jgi:hypothetical protein
LSSLSKGDGRRRRTTDTCIDAVCDLTVKENVHKERSHISAKNHDLKVS